MKMTKRGSYLIVAAVLIACPMIAQAESLSGMYERKDGRFGGGGIDVTDAAGVVKMTVQIGGIPHGAATNPDCGFIAEGKLDGNVFTGTITRQGVLAELSPEGDPAEAGLPPITATAKKGSITFKGSITSKDASVARYCGYGDYSLEGVFVRQK